jgi:hypothetical protein
MEWDSFLLFWLEMNATTATTANQSNQSWLAKMQEDQVLQNDANSRIFSTFTQS